MTCLPGADDSPNLPPPSQARAFSIAFAWGGLIVGGVAWILWFGSQHLPQRGERVSHGMFEFTPMDLVLLAILPFGVATIAGRVGRRWLP